MTGTRIGVYQDVEIENGCVDAWLNTIEEQHGVEFCVNVDAWLSQKLRRLEEADYENWPRIEADLNKGPLFAVLEEKRDGCGGVGRIRFNAERYLHRLLGFYYKVERRFVIYVADSMDRRGKRTKDDFYRAACPIVRLRQEKVLSNEGEIDDWKS